MRDKSRQGKATQKASAIEPSNKSLKKLRQNFEELSAVLESDFTIYLNPKIIARMKELLESRSY